MHYILNYETRLFLTLAFELFLNQNTALKLKLKLKRMHFSNQ